MVVGSLIVVLCDVTGTVVCTFLVVAVEGTKLELLVTEEVTLVEYSTVGLKSEPEREVGTVSSNISLSRKNSCVSVVDVS